MNYKNSYEKYARMGQKTLPLPSKNQVQPQFIVDYSTKKPSQLEAAQAT